MRTNAKLEALEDKRNFAALPRQPLVAEPGAIRLPRLVFSWLVGDEARAGARSVADVALLVALLGAFANRDPSILVGGHFEEAEDITVEQTVGQLRIRLGEQARRLNGPTENWRPKRRPLLRPGPLWLVHQFDGDRSRDPVVRLRGRDRRGRSRTTPSARDPDRKLKLECRVV